MYALTARSKVSMRSQRRVPASNSARHALQAARHPALHSRANTRPQTAWPQVQHETYYYDAAHQSALTLRSLLKANKAPTQSGVASNSDLTVNAVHRLLASLCPREEDDSERHAYFSELMAMHLSELTATEIKTLQSVLKKAGFDGTVMSSVVDEARYREWDFSTGSSQPKERKPMLPSELYRLLDDLAVTADAAEKLSVSGQTLTLVQAQEARNCLAESALSWPLSGQSVLDILAICRGLAETLGMSTAPKEGSTAKLKSRGSMVEWKNDGLIIDRQVFHSLADNDKLLFNELLRDMLELLLTRKLFGENANLWQLSAANKKHLRLAMEEVTSQSPAAPVEALRSSAKHLLSKTGQLGKLQIMPGSGGALGHAWIGNALSIVPDKTKEKQTFGSRYMRTALRLEPDDCTVKQWPIRWLSPEENAVLHPTTFAWHITVPVEAARLQEAATQVASQWKEQGLPFRFIGTTPSMRGTNCRVSVLQAIEQGMEPEARTLFSYFNAGLAEPESPTEIANRMNQFMGWMKQLAGVSSS